MWYEGLFEDMESRHDEKQSEKMAAYMQNQFEFIGIPKPALSKIMKPYLKMGKKLDIDWDFVFLCWEKPYREAQYVGLEYLLSYKKKMKKEDISKLERLITNRSWWETVDSLDVVVGEIVLNHPELAVLMLEWSVSDNLWLRRVAIDFQQEYFEKTNTELLEQIIMNNIPSNEFFINKAIGWSLRDYSKINPDWVQDFVNRHKSQMAPLSVREATKNIVTTDETIAVMDMLGLL